MKKKIAVLVSVLIVLLAIGNFTVLGVFMGKPIIHVYNYTSSDKKFVDSEIPEKGRTLDMVLNNFEEYKSKNPDKNLLLYRTSKRNILEVYEWYDYLSNKRWKYKYVQTD